MTSLSGVRGAGVPKPVGANSTPVDDFCPVPVLPSPMLMTAIVEIRTHKLRPGSGAAFHHRRGWLASFSPLT